jgi:transcriptional regulator GlxA family with amidase domain
MSKRPPFPPKPPATRRVLFLLYPDFQILDAAGPLAAFEIASRLSPHAYETIVASSAGGMALASCGVAWPTEALKGMRFAGVDTAIVVGGMGVRDAAQDADFLKALLRASKQTRRIASVCSGSFALGAAGLLSGKRATTHWRHAQLMQRLLPDCRVEPDHIWIKDGAVWTSAGVTAGIDLALAMIAEDLGPEISKSVAREMVVYAQRPGGQTQHSAMLELSPAGGRFGALNAWISAHLAQDLSVDDLAREAGMSPRNFARAYTSETGVTPAKAVERLRLEAARAAIESGARSVQEIARQTGFGDPERMRRAFIRMYGASPAALKRTLRHA